MQLQFAKLDVSTAGDVASLFSVKRPLLSLGNENSSVKFTLRTSAIKANPILYRVTLLSGLHFVGERFLYTFEEDKYSNGVLKLIVVGAGVRCTYTL